ncbi:MAG: purine-binding chemotaxis protein CheW [Alphaproteobacteria bacterium]|nr:purine-binding chemotaxis protein CheW [Alphaproteobacteria bacterium]
MNAQVNSKEDHRQAVDHAERATAQFIAFQVDDREYAIDILAVREIRGWSPVTAVPNSPEEILGIVNLRGAIVPIVDLKACFGDGKTDIAKSNVVVIVRITQHVVGLVVDAVSDILSVNPSSIQPMPELQAGGAKLVPQIINFEDRLLGVLDLNRIIDLEHLDEVAATVQ